jgi:hypothetical protein
MLDLIKLRPERLFLSDEATKKVHRFTRRHYTDGLEKGGTIVQAFKIDDYAPLKAVARKTRDGRFWITRIEAVLPAMLYGHNGRPIRTIEEQCLALTIVHHILRRLTEPEGHGRIIPGVGPQNLGYISNVECSTTVQDPGHRFIHASHLTRLKNQQQSTGIYLGQSTYLRTRGMKISIYDKVRQMGKGLVESSGNGATRIEAVIKSDLRLGKEVKASRQYAGHPGEVVSTITQETAYEVLRASMNRLTGFGWCPGPGDIGDLCKNAKIIAGALGDHVRDARRVEMALAAYKLNCKPRSNTYRLVARELRAFAIRVVIPDPLSILPDNPADLQWADVPWPIREMEWAALMRDIGAPTEPDPAIVAAWSQTTFLRKKPIPAELVGSVAHGPPPFRKDPIMI